MKGQASFELLVSVGILFGMLAIGLASSANSFAQLRYSGDVLQARRSVEEMSSAIESVHYQGSPASRKLMIEIPAGSEAKLDCEGGLFEIRIITNHGETLAFRNIEAPCQFNGTVSSGTYLVEAGEVVNVTRLG